MLDSGDKFGRGNVVPVNNHQYRDFLRDAIPALANEDRLMNAISVKVEGTPYTRVSVVSLSAVSLSHF